MRLWMSYDSKTRNVITHCLLFQFGGEGWTKKRYCKWYEIAKQYENSFAVSTRRWRLVC